jgi:peptide/nickel transport system substrate-binding protein
MWSKLCSVITLLLAGSVAPPALAQKQGGTLRIYHRDNLPSASIREEATISTVQPFMGVFNNLVLFDQQKPLNTPETIVPDLAESWAWDATNTQLTFKLRQGVKWHDGKPFTAKDVQCTWSKLTGKDPDDFRKNPRAIWWQNLKEVTVNGDYEATFILNRPQPSFLTMFASGYTPVYPCHISTKDMRIKPIGTGPFKFAEFKRGDSIKFVRNADYWKKGKPYLDGIDWKVIENRSTRILAFVAGEFDLTFVTDVTIPLLKDVKTQAPKAICELAPTNVSTNLIVNPKVAPFNDAQVRRALALALDRKAFIDILSDGKDDLAGVMLPPPEGKWGLPPGVLKTLPGYGGDVEKSRAEARKIMEEAGYGRSKPLKVKVSTRDIAVYRDPAVILIDQLKSIYIEGELEVVDTSIWHAKVTRGEFSVGLNLTGVATDDPDVNLYENYACKSERNLTQYCNKEVDALIDKQSQESDLGKRKKLVWEIEKKLAEDVARPIILYGRAATCWQPQMKGFVLNHNSIFNSWRFEDVWLDRRRRGHAEKGLGGLLTGPTSKGFGVVLSFTYMLGRTAALRWWSTRDAETGPGCLSRAWFRHELQIAPRQVATEAHSASLFRAAAESRRTGGNQAFCQPFSLWSSSGPCCERRFKLAASHCAPERLPGRGQRCRGTGRPGRDCNR